MHFSKKKVPKKFVSSKIISTFATANKPSAICPDGGIGRRAGLKHQWSNPSRFDPGSGYQELLIERFVALFSLNQTLTQENLISDSEFTIYKKGVVTHSFLFLSVFKFKISFSPQSCCRQSSYFMIMLFHNHFVSIYNVDA